jgi:hypothetical protein
LVIAGKMADIAWVRSCSQSVWCIALFTPWIVPFLGLWACEPRNRKWMLVFLPLPAIVLLLGAVSELMSAYSPSALAVLGPLGLVAGENWKQLRRQPWFWSALVLAAFLLGFAALSALVGEASNNPNGQYCIGGPASDCRLDYPLLADVFVGYWSLAVVAGGGYLAIVALLVAGIARRRRPLSSAAAGAGPLS